MKIIIYKKINNDIIDIFDIDNPNITKKIVLEQMPNDYDVIIMENLPEYNKDWEYLAILNNELVIKELELTNQQKINIYKKYLKDTDYQAIKFAEGVISEEEYTPIREERKKWRLIINELQKIC